DRALSIVDDYHCPVRKITYPLSLVFAFANDAQGQHFTRQQDHPHGFGNIMQVNVVDRLQLGYFSQVVIVGVKLGAEIPGQANQFGVHLFFIGKVTIVNFYLVPGVFLDPVEHLQAASPPRALDRIRRIRDLLQLFQHKSWKHDQSFNEVGLDQVRDPAVDHYARIQQQQVVRFVLRRESHVRDDQRKILLVASHRQHNADVAEAQKKPQANQPTGCFIDFFKQTRAVDKQSYDRPQQQAERRCGECAQGKALQHFIDGNHQPAKTEADDHAD